MDENKPSLSEILKRASEENERKISEIGSIPEPPKQESAAPEANKPAEAGEEAPKTEEDEIIGKYSQRVRTDPDPKSSTANLRDSLAAQMEKDKELLSYYNNDSSERKNKKFDELYTLINTASLTNVKHRSAEFPPEAGGHFVSEDQIEKPVEYKQQKLFGGGDTITFRPADDTGEVARYDDDYEQLGKKIESGEISFAEDENADQLSLTDDAVVPADQAEQDKKDREEKDKKDKKDIDLMIALQMMDENSEEAVAAKAEEPPQPEEDKKAGKKSEPPKFEYTDRSQNGEIDEKLRRAVRSTRIRLIIAALLTLVLLYLETATKTSTLHPDFLKPGRYGQMYILIDLQVLFAVCITVIDGLRAGAVGLFKRKPTAESVMFVSMLIAAVHAVITLFMDGSDVTCGLLGLPAAASALCCTLADHLSALKDDDCFKVLASKRPKYVAEKLSGTAREGTEFYKYLLDDSELYTVKRADFVDGFFRRAGKRPEGDDLFGFLIAVVFAVGCVLFGVQMYLGEPLLNSLAAFGKLAAFALPFSAFFIISLPLISANRIARKTGSALIGSAVGEEYADASVISFADTEVYPASHVKIASIKVYGDYRIDRIIYDLTRVFGFVGGPLKNVTASMVSGGDTPEYTTARLIESASDGICVVIDGQEMFLGKKSYLRRYRFETPFDLGDDRFETGGGSIMYVTMNDRLIAKVYVKYKISEQFNALLRDMYRAGMCVGIKTVDPNITTSLLENTVKYKKCPISILKAGEVGDVEGRCDRIDSGIVSTASLHTFLKMFIMCDKVRHVTRSNGFINILSIALSFFVVFFLALTGELTAVQSFYPVLFQLLWLLPVCVISFIL